MNVQEIITEKIVKSLEQGRIPWRKTWKNAVPPMNFLTKKPYRGINALLLGLNNASTPYYLTFNQIKTLGGSVMAGSKSELIVYWNWFEKTHEDGRVEEIPFLRYSRVFNLSDTQGIPYTNPYIQRTDVLPDARAVSIIAGYVQSPAIAIAPGLQPAYAVDTDTVFMPPIGTFDSDPAYYAAMFHELIHSTGHPIRLDREGFTGKVRFGSEKYSKEELIAEIGAAFLCGECGIEEDVLDNSMAYIQGWLDVLKGDSRFILSAAGHAQKAVDRIFMTPTPANEVVMDEVVVHA